MAYKVNKHIKRLNRFLPFDPAHDQIYEEYQVTEDSLNLETQALSYAIEATRSDARMIILTGDAGHGKTHLCRRLIEKLLGYDEDEARTLINTRCDGEHVIGRSDGEHGPRLRIFKDFSELGVDDAANRINSLAEDSSAITLICANEGRLRDVLSSSYQYEFNIALLEDFKLSFQDGIARRLNNVHIINLNYQSVSSTQEPRSLAVDALHQWTSGTSWRICADCAAKSGCPMFANQYYLGAQSGELGTLRRDRVNTVLQTTERLGTVVTIREMLMVLAYMLTSGLTCEQVHELLRKDGTGWQHAFIYYNNLFELPPNLGADKLHRIPVLSELRKLDPGLIAIRAIDEKVVNEQGVFPEHQMDLLFRVSRDRSSDRIDAANGIDEVIGNPRNQKERASEANFVRAVVRSLRRRAFFDGIDFEIDPLEQLGFYEGSKFTEIIEGKLQPKRSAELKRNMIAGLHTIQGLQFDGSASELNLVDPAFGDATSHAAIIADSVAAKDIELIPLANKWELSDEQKLYAISKSVNWLDRYIVLRIKTKDGSHSDLMLDLVTFDCIIRASGGVVAEEFYAHDVRKILNFLAQLAEKRDRTQDNISLFYQGSIRNVSIDDGIIQVSS
jgi:hypothetical protein